MSNTNFRGGTITPSRKSVCLWCNLQKAIEAFYWRRVEKQWLIPIGILLLILACLSAPVGAISPIDEYAGKIQSAQWEYAYGFTSSGHPAWGVSGNYTAVTIPIRWLRAIEHGIVLHNHPGNYTVEPSVPDLALLKKFDFREIWIVNTTHRSITNSTGTMIGVYHHAMR